MVKHFAGFSAPEQGINTGPVHGGERELRTTYVSRPRILKSNLTIAQMASSIQACHHRCRCLVYHGCLPLVSEARLSFISV